MGHVHRQIDQDVDLVFKDDLGNLLIGEAQHLSPDIDMATATVGYGVRDAHRSIGEDLKAVMVMRFQQR